MSSEATIRLLVTSGNGPEECRIAVGHVVRQIKKECGPRGLAFGVTTTESDPNSAVNSAIVTVSGLSVAALVARWVGTVQWICKSPVRANHKRRNWFVGVFALNDAEATLVSLQGCDLRFETFRAGGAGGQHQNKTDSAVRVVHIPTGTAVVSRSERSQHRNKAVAVQSLKEKLMLIQSQSQAVSRSSNAQLHNELQRGNPVRVFAGMKFIEKVG